MLTHGEHAEAVQKQVEDQKLPFEKWPKFLRDRPVLLPGLELYYAAFMDLSTTRSIGFGIGPIPITAIYEYADREDFEPDTRQALFEHVRAMDTAFLRYHREKMEAARK
jgi:hypothetical protein